MSNRPLHVGAFEGYVEPERPDMILPADSESDDDVKSIVNLTGLRYILYPLLSDLFHLNIDFILFSMPSYDQRLNKTESGAASWLPLLSAWKWLLNSDQVANESDMMYK